MLPARAFDWQTATARGRDYVTLFSFCQFYGFGYATPAGNSVFDSRNPQGHTLRMKLGSPDVYLDGVHYVMSFPIELGDRDWLVSRMDVIKLFEPVLRPTEISGRHTIRGVVIDAGHGGTDNGAQSRLGAEKNYTIDTAFRLEAILRDAGLKTVLTRRNDVFVDLYERAHIASLYPDYAFVSIHFNSASPEARGLETYCLSPRGAASTSSSYLTRSDIQMLPGNENDPMNILLASLVHSEIIKLNPGDSSMDRGVKRARFVVIKQNQLPAILVEGGFVSNRLESARVNSPDYRQRLAQAIARGLIRFVNVMGNRSMALPNDQSLADAPAPRAQPVSVPPAASAPSGLARDLPPGDRPTAPAATGQQPSVHSSATVAGAGKSSHKKKKGKNAKTVAKSAAPAPGVAPAATATTSGTGAASLNLAEPAVPTPAPGADKSADEPDEPPTVNNESSKGGAPHSDSSSGGTP
jgi:N-acetylmuramoyl-L-alanine amidase